MKPLLTLFLASTIVSYALEAEACLIDEAYETAAKLTLGLNRLEKTDVFQAIAVNEKVMARVRELSRKLDLTVTDPFTFDETPENIDELCIINAEALRVLKKKKVENNWQNDR